MGELEEAVKEFLSQRRIAVAGVSRSSNGAANLIFRKLRDSGHDVYPINPRTAEVEADFGHKCMHMIAKVTGQLPRTF